MLHLVASGLPVTLLGARYGFLVVEEPQKLPTAVDALCCVELPSGEIPVPVAPQLPFAGHTVLTVGHLVIATARQASDLAEIDGLEGEHVPAA